MTTRANDEISGRPRLPNIEVARLGKAMYERTSGIRLSPIVTEKLSPSTWTAAVGR